MPKHVRVDQKSNLGISPARLTIFLALESVMGPPRSVTKL